MAGLNLVMGYPTYTSAGIYPPSEAEGYAILWRFMNDLIARLIDESNE